MSLIFVLRWLLCQLVGPQPAGLDVDAIVAHVLLLYSAHILLLSLDLQEVASHI